MPTTAAYTQEEIKARAAMFTSRIGGTRYARKFTPAAINLAASMMYPKEAERLETRFCRYMETADAGEPNLSFGELVQYANPRSEKEQAIVILVASNLCLLP